MQTAVTRRLAGRQVHDWGPAGAPAVLVVHGLGDHGLALPYRLLAAALQARGLRLFSYDQRGHGLSRDEPALAWAPLRDDLRSLIDALRPQALIGLSMGALLLLDLAAQGGCGGRPLVAVAAPLAEPRASRAALWAARLLGRWLPRLPLKPGLDLDGISADVDLRKAYLGDPLFQQGLRAGLAAELLAAAARLRDRLPTITEPLLLMHGGDDRIAPWDPGLQSRLPAHARLRLWPGGRHNLFIDSGRDAVFAELAAGLALA